MDESREMLEGSAPPILLAERLLRHTQGDQGCTQRRRRQKQHRECVRGMAEQRGRRCDLQGAATGEYHQALDAGRHAPDGPRQRWRPADHLAAPTFVSLGGLTVGQSRSPALIPSAKGGNVTFGRTLVRVEDGRRDLG